MSGNTQESNGVNGKTDTIPLGRYLWTRIKQVGVNRIFGVPGHPCRWTNLEDDAEQEDDDPPFDRP